MSSHPWILSLMIVAACASHHGASTDASGTAKDAAETPQQCEATFDTAFARPCSIASDCVVMAHSDCCHEIDIGVARADLAAAMAAETTFDTCIAAACGGRGCGGQTSAEDGLVPQAGQSIVATCVNQTCSSTVQ